MILPVKRWFFIHTLDDCVKLFWFIADDAELAMVKVTLNFDILVLYCNILNNKFHSLKLKCDGVKNYY
jgi:hypothetical protein